MKVLLGLKGSTDPAQYRNRLQYHPDVFEFYLDQHDLTPEGRAHLQDAIDDAKAVTSRIVMHQPMRYGKWFNEMVTPKKEMPDLYHFLRYSSDTLLDLAVKNDIQLLLHGSYSRQTQHFIDLYPNFETAQHVVFERLDEYAKQGGNHIMFENSISPLFFYGDPHMDQVIFDRNYRLAFDTSHCFIKNHGSNAVLAASLAKLGNHVVHYHLVDSMGLTHDSLTLGLGRIDWARVLPLLNPKASSIFEINLADPTKATEMLNSYDYLKQIAANLE
ncbi:Xylose isomerase protein TIM barrel [Furfurilactobacillus rossiae]|uniref:sugar phosphate isomerase/epimerase n=1 Tax=Furfurilactobacillus rossiae TaxID=231049 RepID=UPI0015B8A2A4|nr:sugar phosphate isomerase/epimerase [Furfurilactobacillus rossiae]MCF6166364.1 sugar phosphate isomerase/epimerase [Furfurilactobacillus rossiae]QLE65067.1 Xylose isomerase protein TIM barrel [Furfurilactobacillus rossiae]